MAKSKFLTLNADFFSSREVKQIEGLQHSDTFIVIWLKLMCLASSIDDNGLIYVTKDVPYTEKSLALECGRSEKILRNALEIFKNFSMLDEKDGHLHIAEWDEIHAERSIEDVRENERIRARNYRSRKKAMALESTEEPENRHVTQENLGSEDGQTEKQEKEKNQKKENKENPLIETQYVEDIDKDINVNNGTTVKDRTIVEKDNIYNIYIKDKGEEETGKTDIPVSEVAVEKSGESVAWSKSSNRANFARLLEKSDSEVFDALRADTPLCDTIRMWLEYKDAKHDYYKNEMSLTTLCKKFVRKNAEVGHEVLLDGVETAISNCWKGIIWDRMTVEKRPVNRVAQELDDFYKRAAAWASREDDDNDFFMGGAF